MSRRTEQEQRRQERAEIIDQDTLYLYVFAEVAAWQQERWMLSSDESGHAEAVTAALGDTLATGITHAMRREAIRQAIDQHMHSLVTVPEVPQPARARRRDEIPAGELAELDHKAWCLFDAQRTQSQPGKRLTQAEYYELLEDTGHVGHLLDGYAF